MDFYTISDDSNGDTISQENFPTWCNFCFSSHCTCLSARNSLKSVLLTAAEKATVQNNFTVHT